MNTPCPDCRYSANNEISEYCRPCLKELSEDALLDLQAQAFDRQAQRWLAIGISIGRMQARNEDNQKTLELLSR